jgi:hypothetical protein
MICQAELEPKITFDPDSDVSPALIWISFRGRVLCLNKTCGNGFCQLHESGPLSRSFYSPKSQRPLSNLISHNSWARICALFGGRSSKTRFSSKCFNVRVRSRYGSGLTNINSRMNLEWFSAPQTANQRK